MVGTLHQNKGDEKMYYRSSCMNFRDEVDIPFNGVTDNLLKFFIKRRFKKDIRKLSDLASQEKKKLPRESYYYIPISPAAFVGALSKYKELDGRYLWRFKKNYSPDDYFTFIDLGCGPGLTVLIAQELFGFKAKGIELDSTQAEIGKKLKLNIIEGSFFDRIGEIKNCRLVYTYMPLHDRKKMEEFSKLVEENMMETSTWIEMLPAYTGAYPIRYKYQGKIYRFQNFSAFEKFLSRKSEELRKELQKKFSK